MRVILLQEIQKLGKLGEVKNVSDGYARNFLIPQKLAESATPKALKNLSRKQAEITAGMERERKHYQELAEKLQHAPLRFILKTGGKGRAFGSITTQDIAAELAKQGIKIEKGWIELEQGIKATGEHAVRMKLPHQIESKVKIIVETEKWSMYRPVKKFMEAAIDEAIKAREDGDYGVGAVIVKDEEVVARASNRSKWDQDPIAHAEMLAIQDAAQKLGTRHLKDCILYTTHEPCPMCASAAVWAMLEGIVSGAKIEDMIQYRRTKGNNDWLWRTIHIPAAEVFAKGDPKPFLYRRIHAWGV